MTPIEKLQSAIKTRFPAATIEVERLPSGNVWLDIREAGRVFIVEYKPPHRYGISTAHTKSGWEGYGEGPDRLVTRYRDAKQYLLRLLRGTAGSTASSKRAHPRTKQPSKISLAASG